MIHTISAGYRGHRNTRACPGDGGVVQCQTLLRNRGSIHLLGCLGQYVSAGQQLGLSRVLCPESVVSFTEYVISVNVTMQVRTVNMLQHLACYGC